MWISEQSPIRCRGTSSRHSMESVKWKTKTSQETENNSRKFQKPSQKPKVIRTYNLLEFGKYYEELSCNHRTTTLHRSERSGIAERAVRRIKEEISAVLLQSGSRMISGGWILWNAVAICGMTKTSWQTGNLKMNENLVNPYRTCFVRGSEFGKKIFWLLRSKNWKS